MRQKTLVITAVCIVLLCTACSSEIDREKFAKVKNSAQAVEISIAAGVSYQTFGELLQKLSAEIANLKETVKSEEEKELLRDCSDLLTMYLDGFLLWKYKIEFASYRFVPKKRIYVGQDVEPIVVKYRFSTESHIFGPTQQIWRSISEDSIQIIWSNAHSQLEKINTLLKG